MKKVFIFILTFEILIVNLSSQNSPPDYWQQRVSYDMNIILDPTKHLIYGQQNIKYYNNSPDNLTKIYFHLYWNAFKPFSSMDCKSREQGKIHIPFKDSFYLDWDTRVKDRIFNLSPDEQGDVKINKVLINKKIVDFTIVETIMIVNLNTPLQKNDSLEIDIDFVSQIPIQIRRSGRNNAEGVMYSMAQWYPKICEYDLLGWHTNQYIAREFYGVWGDYQVEIALPKNFTVAATGELKNDATTLLSYKPILKLDKNQNQHWIFIGKNIHDFVWTADTSYNVNQTQVNPNLIFRTYYKKETTNEKEWLRINWAISKLLPIIETKFGSYPYPVYSFIQGGDGGMEYPMATLLKSNDLGTAIHEFMHSWFQGVLATNEYLYPWMDEGFTNYAEEVIYFYYLENLLAEDTFINSKLKIKLQQQLSQLKNSKPNYLSSIYNSALKYLKSQFVEPMSTPADYFKSNYAYSQSSYNRGAIFLALLGYITGDSLRDMILKSYYDKWKFKHPTPNDLISIAENISDLKLQWFKELYLNTTTNIDYGIINVKNDQDGFRVFLERKTPFPMPIDILITFKNGDFAQFHIPLDLMLKSKYFSDNTKTLPFWQSTSPYYDFIVNQNLSNLKSIEIDPLQILPDINRINNKIELP